MRVYLDNCCYNRPFDEQTQLKVLLETEAKLRVQSLMRNSRGSEIMSFGVKKKDALHLACAERAECDWFLTTDRGILKKIRNLGEMRVANPVDYVMEEQS